MSSMPSPSHFKATLPIRYHPGKLNSYNNSNNSNNSNNYLVIIFILFIFRQYSIQ